jgi:Leucine-rich repeat (LRR) protein
VVLDLSFTNLEAFPNVSSCATTLQRLSLTRTGLTSIPKEVGELQALFELIVDDNKLTALPSEIGSLLNLRTLRANGNTIKDLPPSFSSLVRLEVLHLSRNNFRQVPSVLPRLNLSELHMDNNHITSLPPALGNMHCLTTAQFSSNPITSVPVELGGWWNLQTFAIWNTQVRCIPRSLIKISPYVIGKSYPVCSNDTIAGYLVQRVRNKDTCDGSGNAHVQLWCITKISRHLHMSAVHNVNGTAFGCLDYVHTTCEELGDHVVVTKLFLSDLDSRGLRCEANATVEREEVTTYPRCSAETGVATSCSDLLSVSHLQKHTGMVTL